MTLDDILDMTFDQIALCAETIMAHKVEMLNMVFEPISAALGGKKSKPKKQVSQRRNDPISKRQKEDQKMAQLRYLGIGAEYI